MTNIEYQAMEAIKRIANTLEHKKQLDYYELKFKVAKDYYIRSCTKHDFNTLNFKEYDETEARMAAENSIRMAEIFMDVFKEHNK